MTNNLLTWEITFPTLRTWSCFLFGMLFQLQLIIRSVTRHMIVFIARGFPRLKHLSLVCFEILKDVEYLQPLRTYLPRLGTLQLSGCSNVYYALSSRMSVLPNN